MSLFGTGEPRCVVRCSHREDRLALVSAPSLVLRAQPKRKDCGVRTVQFLYWTFPSARRACVSWYKGYTPLVPHLQSPSMTFCAPVPTHSFNACHAESRLRRPVQHRAVTKLTAGIGASGSIQSPCGKLHLVTPCLMATYPHTV
jgi:hypothetical protein